MGNGDKGQIAVREQFSSEFEAHGADESMRRLACDALEHPGEMKWAQAGGIGELGDRDLAIDVLVHELDRSPDPLRTVKYQGGNRRLRPIVRIGLGQTSSERQSRRLHQHATG